jgi:ectoine hydroxylase-related dioxygenase (phytanoyl-CoA dioxygenase family)
MLTTHRLTQSELDSFKEKYARDGYFIVRNVVSREHLAELHKAMAAKFDELSKSGALFSGGGLVSGHLNAYPGSGARFAYDTLEEYGIIDLIKELDPHVVRLPRVNANYNLPGSHNQHAHTDRGFSRHFMIANIAVVDTGIENGAMEVIPGTHDRLYKYTEIVLGRMHRKAVRMLVNRGDVVVRNSNLWHRGMTNHSTSPRPQLSFTWEDGGSDVPDPFNIDGGEIRFFPNWFKPTPIGRLREQVFVKVPLVYSTLRFTRSLLDSEY